MDFNTRSTPSTPRPVRRHRSRTAAMATAAGAALFESLEARTLLTGTWTKLANNAPGSIGTMLLMPDGAVMAQLNATSADWVKLTPNSAGSYQAGTWSRLSSMHDTRLYSATQVLQDGRLFIAGGEYGTGAKTGEVYDPSTNTWTALPPQSFGSFIDSMSDTLPDGRVLIAPVSPSPSGVTVIFDPATNTWSQGPKIFRGGSTDEQSFCKLADGSLLTVDGDTTSERYIPSQNQWVNDAAVPVTLFDSLHELGPGVLLPDGRAFYIGATSHTAIYTPSGSNAPGSWIAGPDLPAGQGDDDAPGAMLVDGTLLCVSGPSGTYNGPTHFYIYDPTTNAFTAIAAPGGSITAPPFTSRFLDLPDGTVLYTSGGSSCYVYDPGATPLPEAQPAITNVTANADGTFTLTGTLLNGISEGAYYGDDAQMSSNYPIVRLTSSGGTVFTARTYGWSSTGVQTGATPETTNFKLPLGMPAGTYSLTAVVNGVASDPVTLTTPTVAGDAAPTLAAAAAASPSPVTSTTTNLSVLGADDAGEANLTYTWTITSAPSGAPTPSFSVNGTNAAKNATATFYRVGTYTFRVFITDAAGLSTSSSVSVTVNATATSVTVSPSKATLTSGGTTQTLTGTTLDQFGQSMTTATAFIWSLTSGTGSIVSTGTTTGRYTAPASGTLASITATSGAHSTTAQIGVVTSPWASSDIGGPGVTGIASDTGAGGTFTIAGSGNDIWGTADKFRYVYRQLSGDEAITARVVTQQNTNASAKTGVMIRNSLSSADAYAFIELTPTSGAQLQYRATSGASAVQQSSSSGIAAPYWVRLVRQGSTFTAYRSSNGTTWAQQGSPLTITMGTTVYVGLAVCSHDNTVTSTASMDNVTVSQLSVATAAAASPSPVTGKTAVLSVLGADTAGESSLTYTWAATSIPAGAAAPTFSVNGTNTAKNSTATFSKIGTYQFTCTISDGIFSATSVVSVNVNATLTTITVTPASVSLRMGATQPYSAAGFDQFGTALATPPTFNWSVSGAQNAITSAGVLTAGTTAGSFTVTASSGGVNGMAGVTVLLATIANRAIFYNGSAYDGGDEAANAADDGAVATDKSALLPGQTATFTNYTSFFHGINGVMLDVTNLPIGTTLSAATDFTFKIGTTADPTTWADATAPASITVRPGAGSGGADRVTIAWADTAIQNTWLQVTLNATAHTGLAAADIFYFGNLIGETGNNTAAAQVTAADIALTKFMQGHATTITSPVDFNRSGQITSADVAVVKAYQGGQLPLLAAPAAAPAVVTAQTTRARPAPATPAAAAAAIPPLFSTIPLTAAWPGASSIDRHKDLLQ